MSTVNVKPIDIEEGSLTYMGALQLEKVEAEMKEGQWGEYQSGYKVTFLVSTGARVTVTAKKGTSWFDQLNAIRVLNPEVKAFSFERDKNKNLIVTGASN